MKIEINSSLKMALQISRCQDFNESEKNGGSLNALSSTTKHLLIQAMREKVKPVVKEKHEIDYEICQ